MFINEKWKRMKINIQDIRDNWDWKKNSLMPFFVKLSILAQDFNTKLHEYHLYFINLHPN